MLKAFLEEARGGGGRLVAAGAIGVALGISALPFYTLGIFTKPIAVEFGWTRGQVQAGFTAMIIGMLMSGWAWGMAADRFGARRVAIVSQIGLGLGFLALSVAPPIPMLWVALWAGLGLVGTGTAPITWTRNVVAVFDAGRGTALGLTLAGSGIAAFLAPLAITPVITAMGWRAGYAALGLAVLMIAIPVAALIYRDPPRSTNDGHRTGTAIPQPGLAVGEIVRGYRFWLMGMVFAAVTFGVSGLIPNLVPLLTDGGMRASEAAFYVGLAGLAVIAGRIAAGILVDRFWAPGVALGFLALPALSCLLLASDGLPNGVAIGLAAAAIGLAAGAEFDVVAYLCSRYFGMRHYGLSYALQQIGMSLGGAAGPLAFAIVFDRTGSYDQVLYLSAVLFIVGPLLLLLMGRYPDLTQDR